MSGFDQIGVAVIGTGFIGTVHVWALRRLGVQVCGVLGSSPERGAKRAKEIAVARAYASLDELLDDPNVAAVHVTSPNYAHYPQVKRILAAGKHVICEKPLAMTAVQSAEMMALAIESGLVCAVCYNTRFYPLNQHAYQMVADGKLGEIHLVTGHYLQDWLAKDTDWNWRLEADEGGELRAVGDIGTHWIDLASFITGLKPISVFAELSTVIPKRKKPVGPVETFAKTGQGETETRTIETEDAGQILLRFENGARGSLSVSQVSPGRKNSMQWDVAGSSGSAAWNSETPDHLWLGHRDEPNQILQRDAALMNHAGAASAYLPGGHVEGFADTFFALFNSVYADIVQGRRLERSTYASFEDGHFEMRFCEAVLKSSQQGSWVELADV